MTGPDVRRVSLIVTVKNEAATIDALLASVAGQTRLPDEVIVVDGGSSDGTVERVAAWSDRLPLRLTIMPGAGIAAGRNRALAEARGEIVAVTDAGVRLDPDWLRCLIAPFSSPAKAAPDVVGGFFRGDPQTFFEQVLAATTLPDVDEVDPSRFLPSSRSVALRRSLVSAGIRYPDWLDYCEDLVFDLRLKRAGARFAFVPEAVVWFRPRSSVRDFIVQYYRYARGDGKAGLFARRHAARYATYFGFVPVVLLRRDPMLGVLSLLAAAAYMRGPWQRLLRRRKALGPVRLAAALALSPALRLVGDLAKMVGYPVGLAWRVRRYGLRRGWQSIPDGSVAGSATLRPAGDRLGVGAE